MKKNKLVLLLLSTILFSCQKKEVENLFPQSPDARAEAAVNQAQSDLKTGQHGWIARFEFGNGNNENFYNIEFKDNGRAIVSYGEMGLVKSAQTTYTLSYSMQLDLVFDSQSPLSDLVGPSGGDFRFELTKTEDGKYYFKSRNNKTQGIGELQLSRAEASSQYADLVAKQYVVVNNPEKSFFRVLKMNSGKQYHMDVSSLSKSFIEELSGTNEVRRTLHKIVLTDNGFKFENPVVIVGETITHFVAAGSGVFDAYNGSVKVGSLDYGTKAFTAIGNFAKLKEKGEVFMTSSYSPNLQLLVDSLKAYDRSFTAIQFYFIPWMQLPNGKIAEMLTSYRSTGDPRWMSLFVHCSYGNDFIRIAASGFSAPGYEYYFSEPAVNTLFSAFCWASAAQPYQYYDIVIRDEIVYFVQRDDPSIWMIARNI